MSSVVTNAELFEVGASEKSQEHEFWKCLFVCGRAERRENLGFDKGELWVIFPHGSRPQLAGLKLNQHTGGHIITREHLPIHTHKASLAQIENFNMRTQVRDRGNQKKPCSYTFIQLRR